MAMFSPAGECCTLHTKAWQRKAGQSCATDLGRLEPWTLGDAAAAMGQWATDGPGLTTNKHLGHTSLSSIVMSSTCSQEQDIISFAAASVQDQRNCAQGVQNLRYMPNRFEKIRWWGQVPSQHFLV